MPSGAQPADKASVDEMAELRAWRDAAGFLHAAALALQTWAPRRAEALRKEARICEDEADEMSERFFG